MLPPSSVRAENWKALQLQLRYVLCHNEVVEQVQHFFLAIDNIYIPPPPKKSLH